MIYNLKLQLHSLIILYGTYNSKRPREDVSKNIEYIDKYVPKISR